MDNRNFVIAAALVLLIGIGGTYFALSAEKGQIQEDPKIKALEEQIKEQKSKIEDLEKELADKSEDQEEDVVSESKCNFDHGLNLKRGANLDIFGPELWEGEEFDTVICGHFVSKKVMAYSEEQENAYLSIQEFQDPEFKEGILDDIEYGNTINIDDNGDILFNLGCFNNGVIEGSEFDANVSYIDAKTRRAILNSTEDEPVTLLLNFGFRPERGCVCCNLANTIRVIE